MEVNYDLYLYSQFDAVPKRTKKRNNYDIRPQFTKIDFSFFMNETEDAYLVESVQVSITIVCIVGKCRIKDIGPLRWCGHVFSRPPFRLALIVH